MISLIFVRSKTEIYLTMEVLFKRDSSSPRQTGRKVTSAKKVMKQIVPINDWGSPGKFPGVLT